MHRAIKEVNKTCARADRDRQYQQHMLALKKINKSRAPQSWKPMTSMSRTRDISGGRASPKRVERVKEDAVHLPSVLKSKGPQIDNKQWWLQSMDHEYQVRKNSEYNRTLPLKKIVRNELNHKSNANHTFQNISTPSNLSSSK